MSGGPDGEEPEPNGEKKARSSEIKMTTVVDEKVENENMIVDQKAVETISESTRMKE